MSRWPRLIQRTGNRRWSPAGIILLFGEYKQSYPVSPVLLPFSRIRTRFDLSFLPLPTHFAVRLRHVLGFLSALMIIVVLTSLRLQRPSESSDLIPIIPTENPYFLTGDIWLHNEQVSTRLDRCASLGLLRNTSLPIPPEQRSSPSEEADLISQGCGTNETTIIILASLWAAEAYSATSTAGEEIYAQSVISTLNALNYSYVFSNLGWWNSDMRKTVELWHKHRWNVRAVLADPDQVDLCWRSEEQGCLKTESNPEGIEAWRLLSFWYWDE